MILLLFFYYALLAFGVFAGLAVMIMLFIIKWVIAIMVALVLCAIEGVRGEPMHFKINKPATPKPQAFYSSRR